MADMFGGWTEHFRPQKQAAAMFGIYLKESLVAQHDAAAPLVLEGHDADCEAMSEMLVQLVQSQTY